MPLHVQRGASQMAADERLQPAALSSQHYAILPCGSMALNIKDADRDRLARELAELTGERITRASHRAIQLRLARERARRHSPAVRHVLTELIERGRARETIDARTAEEILGYDATGLPT
jgi:antitoxin VapB